MSMQYPNTPAKGRPLTQKASKATVDPHHAIDAGNYTNSGITFEKFLEIAFHLSPKAFRDLHKKAKGWIAGEDEGAFFKKNLEEYKSRMAGVEGDHYNPFINLWNSVIETMVKTGDIPAERRVKLLNTSSRPIPGDWGARKPDISVTPVHIDYPPRGSLASKAAPQKEASTSTNAGGVASTSATPGSTLEGQRTSSRVRASVKRARPLTPDDDDSPDGDPEDETYVDVNAAHDVWLFISWLVILAIFEFKSAGPGPPLGVDSGATRKDKVRATKNGNKGRLSKRRKTVNNMADTRNAQLPRSEDQVDVGEKNAPDESVNGKNVSTSGRGLAGGSNGLSKSAVAARSNSSTGNGSQASNKTLLNPRPNRPSVGQALDESKAIGLSNVDTQIAGYVTEMKSARGDRKHTFSAGVHGLKMWLYFHSNSGIVRSYAIDFERKPECVAMYIALLMLKPLSDIGFNELSGFRNPFDLKDTETLKVNMDIIPLPSGNMRKTQPILKNIRISEKIDVRYCFLGRGTCVYRLLFTDGDYEYSLIGKFSWEPEERRQEELMILEARDVDPNHTPEIFGSSVAAASGPFAALRDACKVKAPMFEVRQLRLLVMREYLPITRITDGSDFVEAMHQLMFLLHELYKKKRILHRDIGIHNLMYYNTEEDKLAVVPIDYGLASAPSIGGLDPTADHRSVNFPFSACEILLNPGCAHGLHHDLESVLYCAVWYGIGYRQGKPFPFPQKQSRFGKRPDDHLKKWRTGTARTVFLEKRFFLNMPPTPFTKEFDLIESPDVRSFCFKMQKGFSIAANNAIASQNLDTARMTYSCLMKNFEGWAHDCPEQCCGSESGMSPSNSS